MYINRIIEDKILKYLHSREIIAIIGPRQCGKTTTLQHIQKNLNDSIFLSFEDRDVLELFESDIKNFAIKYSAYKTIFIDEFQYAANGGKLLKYIYDSFPDIKIFISGSSAIDLTVKALKYLVGRIFVFELYPLSFEEYISYKDPQLAVMHGKDREPFNIEKGIFNLQHVSRAMLNNYNKHLAEFILYGGYPRVVTSNNIEEKKEVLKNIYNTYFLREVRDVLGLIDDFKLSSLIKTLAIQNGQLISYNELSVISSLNILTVKKYFNILDKTFICKPIRPFFTNKNSELVKNPKLYFYDTGLRNHIYNNYADLGNRGDKGSLYENFVFTQLIKKNNTLNYWRTKQKTEIDFIVISEGNKILGIECKSKIANFTVPKSFYSFIEKYKPANMLVLNEDKISETGIENTKIRFMPYCFI